MNIPVILMIYAQQGNIDDDLPFCKSSSTAGVGCVG